MSESTDKAGDRIRALLQTLHSEAVDAGTAPEGFVTEFAVVVEVAFMDDDGGSQLGLYLSDCHRYRHKGMFSEGIDMADELMHREEDPE